MHKEFIPYEEALALKKLGFDEPCITAYFNYNRKDNWNGSGIADWDFIKLNEPKLETIEGSNKTNSKLEIIDFDCNAYITAPLYQQAFRWFREKYNLIINIQTYVKGSWLLTVENIESTTDNGVYNGKRWELDNDENYVDPKSYEEAELLCLKKLIEIVKSR